MADTKRVGGKNKSEQQHYWTNQLSQSKKEVKDWQVKAQKIVNIYLDKRSRQVNGEPRYNLFTANTNNLRSALFGRIPKPDVSRRFNDPNDHAGRTAANIFQRALRTELENDAYFVSTAKAIITDRLVPGGGFAWVRYKAEVKKDKSKSDDKANIKSDFQLTENPNDERAEEDGASPIITAESTPAEHIHWRDFLWSPARTWNEVTWVARRTYLGKDEFTERFPEHEDIVKSAESETMYETNEDDEPVKSNEFEVWEIWDKTTRKVYFVFESASEILGERDDPFGLPNFFPCPKPLFANLSTTNFMPSPDYLIARDQYEELNRLNSRRSEMIDACRAAGVYDGSTPELADILNSPGGENVLIPVKNWGEFMGEKGGVSNAIQWIPIQQFATVIQLLDQSMAVLKGQIEDLTGISDIVRGSTSPYETASAQEMKGQYASMRFNSQQAEVAEFFSEMIKIKAFLMAKFYKPETLLEQAGMLPVDGIIPPSNDAQYIPAALALLKNELLSHINVEISVDALVANNDAIAVQQKTQVLNALGDFIGRAVPVVQAAPELKGLMLQMIKSQVAGMPGARELEGVIDQELTKALAGPDPAAQQAQQQAQQAQQQAAQQAAAAEQQQKMALEQAKLEQAVAIEQERGRVQLQMKQMELDHDNTAGKAKLLVAQETDKMKIDIERMKLELELRKTRLEEVKIQQEYPGLDTSELALPLGDGAATSREQMMGTFMQMIQTLEQNAVQQSLQLEQLAQTVNSIATAPMPETTIKIEYDSNGRVIGGTAY